MTDKLVSVIIPTYKRPVTLPRAIDSVLNSTWKNVEVIVVDDNNDGDEYRRETETVMSEYLSTYQNVKYEKHKENKNGSAARNTGIRASSGEYIMFLDDDDEFLPEKIAAQVAFMEKHDETWGACYTGYLDIRNGKVSARGLEKQEGDLLVHELARNLFVHAGSNLMVRRSVVLDVNGFDESFQRNQDVEFLVRILKKYKLGCVKITGLKVYLHSAQNKNSFLDYTAHFIDAFKEDISQLPEEDQKAIYKIIGLQKIRYSLLRREYGNVRTFMKEENVTVCQVVHYLFHLAGRLMIRGSYGYPMKNLY